MNDRPRASRGVLRAWLIFLGALAVLRLVIDRIDTPTWDIIDQATARLTVLGLRMIGVHAHADGTQVSSSLYAFDIIQECTAVHVMAIYLAAVAAYPCRARAKLVGAAVGIPAIVAINQVRLVGLHVFGHYFPASFETAHLIAGQGLIIFAVLMLWMSWVVWIAHRTRASA